MSDLSLRIARRLAAPLLDGTVRHVTIRSSAEPEAEPVLGDVASVAAGSGVVQKDLGRFPVIGVAQTCVSEAGQIVTADAGGSAGSIRALGAADADAFAAAQGYADASEFVTALAGRTGGLPFIGVTVHLGERIEEEAEVVDDDASGETEHAEA